MEENEVVVLIDEDGEEHEFTIEGIIEVDGNEYAIVVPLDEEEADEGVILRIETDEDEEKLFVEIEDDHEWKRVAEAWEAVLDEDFEDIEELNAEE